MGFISLDVNEDLFFHRKKEKARKKEWKKRSEKAGDGAQAPAVALRVPAPSTAFTPCGAGSGRPPGAPPGSSTALKPRAASANGLNNKGYK